MTRAIRIIRLVVAGALVATAMLVAASPAPARPRCTIEGTPGNDRLADSGEGNVICAKGGDDLVEAGPRADKVYGGKGSDQLEGNEGRDLVVGGAGADTIVVADGTDGNDRAAGGKGRDTCYIDRGDRTRGCETKTIVG